MNGSPRRLIFPWNRRPFDRQRKKGSMAQNLKTADANSVALPQPETAVAQPDEASIAELAYQLWMAKGCPQGSDQDDWLLAESILKNRSGEPPILE